MPIKIPNDLPAVKTLTDENIFVMTETRAITQDISRQDYHLTQPYESEEKQTNKNSAQISPYMKLTQTTGPTLGGQKSKGKKEFSLEA